MLDTSNSGKGLNTRNVSWKQKARHPLDPSRVAVWRGELSERQNQMTEALIGDRLEKYGYNHEAAFDRYGEIIPSAQLAAKYEMVIAEFADSGVRFWQRTYGEKPSISLFLGDPGETAWSTDDNSKGLSEFISVSIDLIRARLSNNKVYWVSEYQDEKWTGISAFFLKRLMSSYKVSPEPSLSHDQELI
jgi:hypothetical protein